MKVLLLFAVLAGLGGYSIWEHAQIGSLREQVGSLTQQLNASRNAPVRKSLVQRIACPLCKGERRVVPGAPGQTSITAHAIQCPVCVGVGYRDLKVLPGYVICPDCKGMGI